MADEREGERGFSGVCVEREGGEGERYDIASKQKERERKRKREREKVEEGEVEEVAGDAEGDLLLCWYWIEGEEREEEGRSAERVDEVERLFGE